jgi:hypothetical protein
MMLIAVLMAQIETMPLGVFTSRSRKQDLVRVQHWWWTEDIVPIQNVDTQYLPSRSTVVQSRAETSDRFSASWSRSGLAPVGTCIEVCAGTSEVDAYGRTARRMHIHWKHVTLLIVSRDDRLFA